MTNWNQTWTPSTDKEIDNRIKKAKANRSPEPRPLSLVRFADDSLNRQEVLDDLDDHISNYSKLLYLGSVPNQLGHGAYVNLKFNSIHVVDIDELIELTEDET